MQVAKGQQNEGKKRSQGVSESDEYVTGKISRIVLFCSFVLDDFNV